MGVIGEFLLKLAQAGVELIDGSTGHRRRGVEQKHARTPRFGIVDEGHLRKGNLGEFCHGLSLIG